MHGERGGSYGVLLGKPGGRGALGRPKRTWENSIEADFYEIGWGRILILLNIGAIGGLL
jgi:hypothetical protein